MPKSRTTKPKEPRFDKNLDLGPLPPYGTELFIDTYKERLVGQRCPYCRKDADGATRLSEGLMDPKPKPGIYSVCCYCGGLSIYDEMTKLSKIDRADRRKLLRASPELRRLVAVALESADIVKRGVQ